MPGVAIKGARRPLPNLIPHHHQLAVVSPIPSTIPPPRAPPCAAPLLSLARRRKPTVGAAPIRRRAAPGAEAEAELMEAARDDSTDMLGGSLDVAATMGRYGEASCDLHKMEKALRGTSLHIHSSNELTMHPANGLLIQALQNLVQSACYTNEHYSHMLHCWASKLEEDAEMIRPGKNGGKYIFLLNNACGILQMMRLPKATFANEEMGSRLNSMIQRYTKSYIDECWVPLNNTLHINLDEFTAEFLATCGNQMTWKVVAELRYQLREEIVEVIVPPYEVSLSALQVNRSRLSEGLCSFRRVIACKKRNKYTGEELKVKIRALFEG